MHRIHETNIYENKYETNKIARENRLMGKEVGADEERHETQDRILPIKLLLFFARPTVAGVLIGGRDDLNVRLTVQLVLMQVLVLIQITVRHGLHELAGQMHGRSPPLGRQHVLDDRVYEVVNVRLELLAFHALAVHEVQDHRLQVRQEALLVRLLPQVDQGRVLGQIHHHRMQIAEHRLKEVINRTFAARIAGIAKAGPKASGEKQQEQWNQKQ